MEIKPEMDLEIGSEERFLDFIKNIKKEDRVALISHTDLDGISCPKIITEVIRSQKIKFVDYPELNADLIEELEKEDINKVIFTDLYIHEKSFVKDLEEFTDILIIDHHKSPDWNSDRTTLIKANGYCATYICYYLFSKLKNIEQWDWLVGCTCISDYFYQKPKRWLSKVMKKYGGFFEYGDNQNMRHSGKFWDLQYTLSLAIVYFGKNRKKVYESIGNSKFGDIGDLGKHAKEVMDEVDSFLKKFDKEKEEINRGWYFEFHPHFGIKSIVANEISQKDPNKIFVMVKTRGELYSISVRRQDKKFDCHDFLSNLLEGLMDASGGGHIPAAGGHFLKKDLPEVRRRLGLPEKQHQNL